jgi:glucose/arabinose dehydrogenase
MRSTAAAVICALVACLGIPMVGVPLPPEGTGNLRLELVASGLSNALYLTAPAADMNRLFIVEQEGRIRIVRNGQLLDTAFLDITGSVGAGGERGLLGLAFHPSYATNGYFYVDYTDTNGDTRIERYTVSVNPDVADTASRKPILFIAQPYANHNGGLVLFGPDGKLYIGMGDGGSGGDPQNRAQNRDSLLGKLLRIDVDAGDPYAVPPDNPFAAGGGRGEIWALGLRNPWRFSFDTVADFLYIADVGQNAWEEVDVAPASQGGLNYGWRIMEGAHCYRPSSCSSTGLVLPALEYRNGADGCSVIGGFVYRGTRSPSLAGQYFFADLCQAWVRSFKYANGAVTERTLWNLNVGLGNVLSFGGDAAGELYVLTGGSVYRIAAAP